MPLEGLRAWIGEVERKLGKRTRVFLVLSVIAIGIAGASIYLAIDARESSVSESDVQALQEKLERRIDEVAASSAATPIEPQPETAPESESAPKSEPGQPKQGSGSGTGKSPQSGSGGVSGAGEGASGNAARLPELLEKAKEQNAEAE